MRVCLAALFLFCLIAPARADIYNCDITPKGTGDWLPTRLLVDHTPHAQTADVWDPLIKYFVGKPMTARVVTENPKRVTIAWEITRLTNTQGQGRQYTPALAFRATILKPSLKVVIRSKPRGYPNGYLGQGACRIR
ncbi:hypothetical protein MUY35_02025 [Aliiroseovarius sp. S1339]|uniref:hypothetical protein n=1 Tax=Aliiroseovarius sp. S1339 TaxID=2936990 RepID=UPI0020BFCB3B|nr:hypothetical protein [Aliiroseovarius sp. S1339]MCK8462627.1 hypothetical protein [Aliiroseovarius sp. S1339]